MGKGGGDPTYYRPQGISGTAQPHRVSSTRRTEKFGGNGTTDAVDGSQYPPGSSESQSQNPARSSVRVEASQDTDLAAKARLPTPDSVVPEEVPKNSGQATERATSGVPNPDSEGLGGLNEGSEKALVVQLHGALHELEELDRAAGVFHAVARTCIAVLRRCARSLDYNLRQKQCEYILPNGEKAGESSSEGNLAESSDAPYGKRKMPPGVRPRNGKFVSEIRLRGMRNKFWLGTYKTTEEAAQAFQAAAEWREARRDSKSFNKEELDDLKKRAEKAAEHLSDDRSHHNVASPDLVENLEEKATTLASLKRKEVASAEHVSQWESPAQENPFLPSEFEQKATTLARLKGKAVASAEHVSQWESRAHENLFSPSEVDWVWNVFGSEEVGLQQETNAHWCHALNGSQ